VSSSSGHHSEHLERLHRTAVDARDLLAAAGVDRWELYAKASASREVTVTGGERGAAVVENAETGVAIRTRRQAASGFAAAAGLEPAAWRVAVDLALQREAHDPVDPVPPEHLLGAREVPEPPSPPPAGWAQHTAERLANELGTRSKGRVTLLRASVRIGHTAWILHRSEGFVATCHGSSCYLLLEAIERAQRTGVWRELVHVPSFEQLDPATLAQRLADRIALMTDPFEPAEGIRDVIANGEVTAQLVSALVPLFLATPEAVDPLPGLLDRNGRLAGPDLSLVDDRAGEHGLLRTPCDGEGILARRITVLDEGIPRHRLASYRHALACDEHPQGGAVRHSYRELPTTGIANLEVLSPSPLAPRALLEAAPDAVYLLRLNAPVEVDLAADRYRMVAAALDLGAGRSAWVPSLEARGSVSRLLQRIDGVATDRSWFSTPAGMIAAPTLLVRRQPVLSR
jgi:predicted Zn-dependent protease